MNHQVSIACTDNTGKVHLVTFVANVTDIPLVMEHVANFYAEGDDSGLREAYSKRGPGNPNPGMSCVMLRPTDDAAMSRTEIHMLLNQELLLL